MGEVKKRILIHTLIFHPDMVSTSYLYQDICMALIESGFEVTVITTWPHYNYSSRFQNESKRGFFCRKSNFFGANVYHVNQKKSRYLLVRAIYILWFHFFFIFKSLTIKKFDFVLTPSPPLSAGFLSGIVAKLRGAKSVYNVQEIYPDVLIKQSGGRLNLFIKILSKMEYWTYSLSTKVVTIDQHFSDTIKSRLNQTKLACIPNFIDTHLYKPYTGQIDPRLAFDGKFVIGYVGNLGKVQDWDSVIEAAKICQADKSIHFLIIGGGSEFEFLKRFESSLENFSVWPYQDREHIPSINSRIDLHIISMNQASDYDGLPSKVFAILSSGRPILAATNNNSPLARIIEKSGNGLIVARNNAVAISQGIYAAKKGCFTQEMSELGREYIVKNFSKSTITQKYVKLFKTL